ncbi:MAG: hypothetical protein MUP09_01465 [Thiovulaceae bacterium]|nr:hypothetical protein [Sulfurimonadaceae bacterium]
MKNVLLALIVAVFFLGCSKGEPIAVESKIVVGNSLETLELNDQFGKPRSLSADTKKVIFAFSKDMGHMSNAFFDKKEPDFLAEHKAVFIADVSGAPSLIRSMFIMPGLKEFKHPVLVTEDEKVAASYCIQENSDKVMILDLDNFIIKNIRYATSEDELSKAL